jgi:gamma-glutamyltranspeptidase/glutathione hydrolase
VAVTVESPATDIAVKVLQSGGDAIQPNKRTVSSLVPTIVLRDGKFYFTAGSPGGPTDFHMNVQLPDELRLEGGFSPDTLALLESRGHKMKLVATQGEAAAILWDGKWLQGAVDGRTEGTAKGF